VTFPGPDELKRLLGWTPQAGVLSVCVAIDPADRGGGWHVALTDELRAVRDRVEPDASHDVRVALRAALDHVLERFTERTKPLEGRGHVGFVEVARRKPRERWYSSQMPPRRTVAAYGHRAYLRPVVEVVDEGGRIGVVAVSGDRVRIWEWEEGMMSDVGDVELTIVGDWRERKAQRSSDTARVQGAKAAGRDQYDQRLEANRERFLNQVADRVAGTAGKRGWRDLLAFGENEHMRRFTEALGPVEARHVYRKNIVTEPASAIAERVDKLIPDLNRERELKLVETAKESAYSGKERGSLGPTETLEALVQGRVEHLLFDAERDYRGRGIEEGLAYEGPPLGVDGLPVTELMIERALETDARVTPLEGEAAAALDEHDGVVALLRY
jgi:Bacterial archaeo-eukaryotic release factor family 5